MDAVQRGGDVDVVVIGAGQAGLSAAIHLRRLGFRPGDDVVVLDGADRSGGAWAYRPPTLTMQKVHGVFDLPGMQRVPGEDDADRSAAEVVGAYYDAAERHFDLRVQRPMRVRSVSRGPRDRLVVATADRTWTARAVVNATGTWTRPHWPSYPGMRVFSGRQTHSADYRGPAEFAGARVIVVGGGNSAVHVLSEVADAAASVTWATRRPPQFREGEFTPEVGRSVVAAVDERVRAGLPPRSVVSVTGLGYTSVVRDALAAGVLERVPMFDRLVPGGAVWADGSFVAADAIVWATGFRAELAHLAPLRLREHGGGIRMDGTHVVAEPRVHLVGYGPSASTVGANRAGRDAAVAIRRLLDEPTLAAA